MATKLDRVVALSDCLSIILHELRQPLALSGSAQSIILKLCESESFDRTRVIEKARRTQRHLEEISDIVQFIDRFTNAGSIEKQRVPGESIVALLNSYSQNHSNVILDIPPSLPFHTNRIGLFILLKNLVINGVEATAGHGSVSVCATQVEPGVAEIIVTDEGRGLTDEQISTYGSLQSTKDSLGESHGHGNRIVAFLCEALDIELSIHSNLGVGSEFHLKVPLAK